MYFNVFGIYSKSENLFDIDKPSSSSTDICLNYPDKVVANDI